MTASTTAQAIAARCVSVDRRGPLHHVLIRQPGTDRFVTWSTSGEGEVQRHVDDAVRLLAAFVDLGLAHERARREATSLPRQSDMPWVPARHDHDRHDDDDGDPA